MDLNLSINKDTRGSANNPIPAPRLLALATTIFPYKYEFPVAHLVNVSFDPKKEVKRNDVTENVPALIFLFKDKDKRQFTHIEFPLDPTDDKIKKKQDALLSRIKHIWDETIGADKLPAGVLEGKSFAEFYENVAKGFNAITYTKDDKTYKTYSANALYIKLSYYNANLQLPQYPNFIQPATSGGNQKVCELRINPTYDSVEPKAKAKAGGNQSGHNNEFGGGESFGGNFSEDLPDIE
jgi:hypothetical protein